MEALLKLSSYKFWAMDPATFARLSNIVIARANAGHDSLLRGFEPGKNSIDSKRAEFASFQIDRDPDTGQRYFRVNDKSIAYVPIWGSLTKDGDLCTYGMRDYGNMIKRAENSKNIDAILLDFNDCPGGTVDGTPELASVISQTTKPIVSFVDGMAASAGVWLASQSDHIMANSLNYTEIGSIGVLYVHVDARKWVEDKIGNVEIIRAPQSKDKARLNSFEEIPEEERKTLLKDLEDIASDFFEAVKTGRTGKLSADALDKKSGIFTGKMYRKEEAKDLGLIDSIGTFADALQLAADMAVANGRVETHSRASLSDSQSNPNSNMKIKSTWSAILAFFGISAADAEKEQLTEERAEELNAELSNLQSKNAALEAEISQLRATVATHEATIAQHVATIADQRAQLEAAPAGNATSIVADQDKGPENGAKKDDFHTSVDDELKSLLELTR